MKYCSRASNIFTCHELTVPTCSVHGSLNDFFVVRPHRDAGNNYLTRLRWSRCDMAVLVVPLREFAIEPKIEVRRAAKVHCCGTSRSFDALHTVVRRMTVNVASWVCVAARRRRGKRRGRAFTLREFSRHAGFTGRTWHTQWLADPNPSTFSTTVLLGRNQ